MCNYPSPSFGGSWCLGNATEFQNCNAKACPGILPVIPYYFKILFRSKLYNRLCAVVYLILEQISIEILTKIVICNYIDKLSTCNVYRLSHESDKIYKCSAIMVT